MSFVAKFLNIKKDPESGGASEGNGLFILCSKPESEEDLVEYVPL
jgi:hypothetical protein